MTYRFLTILLGAASVLSFGLFIGCGNSNTAESESSAAEMTTEQKDNSDLLEEIQLMRDTYIAQPGNTADLAEMIAKHNETADTVPAEEAAAQPVMPTTYRIRGVPKLSQLPDFPTGCESVSAVMILQYGGEDISADTFIDKYLKKSDAFYHKNDVCYGPDPQEYFIGNPREETSYGCMASVIENAMIQYLGSDQRVCNTTGVSLHQICAEYISNGIPVMVWTSMKMEAPRPGSTWRLEDGSDYQWLANEHCMVLVGYDETYYYFNDPYAGKEVRYKKDITEKRYAAFEMQSVAFLPNP